MANKENGNERIVSSIDQRERQKKKDREFIGGEIKIRYRTLIINDLFHYQISNVSSFTVINLSYQTRVPIPWRKLSVCVACLLLIVFSAESIRNGFSFAGFSWSPGIDFTLLCLTVIHLLSWFTLIAVLPLLAYTYRNGRTIKIEEYALYFVMNSGGTATVRSKYRAFLMKILEALFEVIDQGLNTQYDFNIDKNIMNSVVIEGNSKGDIHNTNY